MKTYIVKPEYLDKWQANSMTIITEDDIDRLAEEWEMDEYDLRQQLIEQEKTGFTARYRYAGKPDWQELNELIRHDDGIEEPFFEDEDAYKLGVREGFVRYDGYYTTIYFDEMG